MSQYFNSIKRWWFPPQFSEHFCLRCTIHANICDFWRQQQKPSCIPRRWIRLCNKWICQTAHKHTINHFFANLFIVIVFCSECFCTALSSFIVVCFMFGQNIIYQKKKRMHRITRKNPFQYDFIGRHTECQSILFKTAKCWIVLLLTTPIKIAFARCWLIAIFNLAFFCARCRWLVFFSFV